MGQHTSSDHCRALWEVRQQTGKPYAYIAETFGMPVTTVRRSIRRHEDRLVRELAESRELARKAEARAAGDKDWPRALFDAEIKRGTIMVASGAGTDAEYWSWVRSRRAFCEQPDPGECKEFPRSLHQAELDSKAADIPLYWDWVEHKKLTRQHTNNEVTMFGKNVTIRNKNCHELHVELWDWLAKNPGSDKRNWPRWARNGGDIPDLDNDCFACRVLEFVNKPCGKYGCPLRWPHPAPKGERHPACVDTVSLFEHWGRARDSEERTRLAAAIRDLKWVNPRRRAPRKRK